MTYTKFINTYFITLGVLLFCAGMFVFVFDPFFHYHKPLPGWSYRLTDQRYINNGIARHFEYDAIITGTSMTQNFKASEMDRLFDVKTIKTPFSGAYYREINEYLTRATHYNKNIKIIVRGLDGGRILMDKDTQRYPTYPTYLYDENPFNDVNYLFNKSTFDKIIQNIIKPTYHKQPTTTFDEYSNWMKNYKFGKELILERYKRPEKQTQEQISLTPQDKEMIYGHITQNVTTLAKDNPQIEFYLFFPPYSILYFDSPLQQQNIPKTIDIYVYASELLLQYPNIKLFSFFDRYDIITNLDLYKDSTHYHEDINSLILQNMREDKNLLTKDNYIQHFEQIRQFYLNYDYDHIFE